MKLTKEKRKALENTSRAEDDYTRAKEKHEYLVKIKTKLMVTIDEIESVYEDERRQKLELDKQRRKLEIELKANQHAIEELQKSQKELENCLARKDSQQNDMVKKLDTEQTSVTKIQKQIKEYQSRVEELEEELEAERQAHQKVSIISAGIF